MWDIDFAEIFGEKGGFDIVIGNPPYVRQEKIAPPNRTADEVTLKDRRDYKEKLQKSLLTIYPFWRKISGRSDYYIYFYFHGLNLLNPRGTFCFITSNSWLDVDYGKDLQEFLLKYVPMHAIYDNHAKRSFKHADVNTVIVLFGAPVVRDSISAAGRNWPALHHTVKFVAFKKAFQEVVTTSNLLAIDKATELVKKEEFRVFPITQEELLEEGWEYPEKQTDSALLIKGAKKKKFGEGKYVGNKWGGKYLRAPEIFFTILEKGKGKLVRLGDIAEVRFGIKTGANDFFYVEDVTDKNPDLGRVQNLRDLKSIEEIKQRGLRVIKPSKFKKNDRDYKLFLVEAEYLKPVVKSPREIKSIVVKEEDLKFKVIMCHESKRELRKKNAFILEYIKWGETKSEWKEPSGRYNPPNLRPTCRSRKYWWAITLQLLPDFIWFKAFNDRFIIPFLKRKHLISDRFYAITTYELKNDNWIINSINSVVQNLFCEINGRVNLAEGALDNMKFEVNNILILKISKIRPIFQRELRSIFEEYGLNINKPIRDQEPKPLPDRKRLDDIVFDELGLTKEERKEVYWAVA
ncbi:MAG: hypothetical protein GXO78_12900, partial [Calditrichaeota bacterium]|nr:hypothetical protein [Calditrichota bacterium]